MVYTPIILQRLGEVNEKARLSKKSFQPKDSEGGIV